MHLTTAVLVDDRPDQLRMLARVLERAGWQVYTATGSAEGEALAAHILAGPDARHTVILTDLHMPGDPYAATLPAAAGAYLALRLRTRMVSGELPRAPIIAITGLPLPETRLAALACGCDALLDKSPPLDLAARVIAELEHTYCPDRPFAVGALLGQAPTVPPCPVAPKIAAHDVTGALLAYRRYGVIGLGESALALALAPQATSVLQRGEAAYARLTECLDELARQGAGEAAAILHTELERQIAPATQQLQLARSKTAYYRLRRAAIQALIGLLAQHLSSYYAVTLSL